MEESRPLNRALIDAAAGAISGGISRTVTSPLDVIKIRFQVQLEPTSSWELLRKGVHESSKYTGMMQATKAILREEGLPVPTTLCYYWFLFEYLFLLILVY